MMNWRARMKMPRVRFSLSFLLASVLVLSLVFGFVRHKLLPPGVLELVSGVATDQGNVVELRFVNDSWKYLDVSTYENEPCLIFQEKTASGWKDIGETKVPYGAFTLGKLVEPGQTMTWPLRLSNFPSDTGTFRVGIVVKEYLGRAQVKTVHVAWSPSIDSATIAPPTKRGR